MEENDKAVASSPLADKLKNKQAKKTEQKPASLDAAHDKLMRETAEAFSGGVLAPFPVGTRVRYVVQRYLSEGYTRAPVLEPGTVVTIRENAGAFSIYEVQSTSGPIELVISQKSKKDWILDA